MARWATVFVAQSFGVSVLISFSEGILERSQKPLLQSKRTHSTEERHKKSNDHSEQCHVLKNCLSGLGLPRCVRDPAWSYHGTTIQVRRGCQNTVIKPASASATPNGNFNLRSSPGRT